MFEMSRGREIVLVLLCLWITGSTYALELNHSNLEENKNGTEWETASLTFSTETVEHSSHNASGCHTVHSKGIHLVSIRWAEVGAYFTVTAFVIIAGFTKLGFHHLHWLSNRIPESCVLVILGAMLGLIVFFTTEDHQATDCQFDIPLPHFTSDLFFLVLLPPIVLESAYSLHDRSFFDNLGTVLVYAVVGTMFNIFSIGPTLFGLASVGAMGNITLSIRECLVFSSLISAVDPVAVLVIFQELGVNKDLYFLVFGESLLNDGVTVVVYNTMIAILPFETVPAAQYALAVLAFFIVVIGGITIGIIYGFLTALITKSTTDVRVVEPLAMLGLAYLCYLTAELFHFSGIISLIVCGLVQAHYAFQNISQKSYTCVKYFTKMASATSDTIIFMFLGMVLVSDRHVWHTGFVLWTVALCFIFRFVGVFLLTGIMNHYRIKKIGLEEQFIAAYGGLRGAVAFSLVNMLDEGMEHRSIFMTTTLVVILFTIFIQGMTIKPLVDFLHIQRRRSDRKNLNEEINDTAIDHIMAGVEEVLGQHGDFYLRAVMIYYNDKYLNKWFVRPTCESKLTRLFEKIAISEHYAHLYGPVAMIEDKVKPLCGPEKTSIKRLRTASISPSFRDEALLDPELLLKNEVADELANDSVQLRKKPKSMKRSHSLLPTRYSTRRVAAADEQHPHAVVSDDEREEDEEEDGETSHRKKSAKAAQALRKAFKENPYNKLHYKYNPNLVGEEDQEISEHLQRRHLNARRMSRLAYSLRNPPSAASQRSRPKTEGPAGGEALRDGVAELMDRHTQRRNTMAIRRRRLESETEERHPLQLSYMSSPESSVVGSPVPGGLHTVTEVPQFPTGSAHDGWASVTTPSTLEASPRGSSAALSQDSPTSKKSGPHHSSSQEQDEELSLMYNTDNLSTPTSDDQQSEEKV